MSEKLKGINTKIELVDSIKDFSRNYSGGIVNKEVGGRSVVKNASGCEYVAETR